MSTDNLDSLRKRITELQTRLEKAEAEERELQSLTPVQQFATYLHLKFCRANHPTACTWFTELPSSFTTPNKTVWFRYALDVINTCKELGPHDY